MSTESETPRRLVAADYARMNHEALIAALTRTAAEPYVSVEFTRNAKGDTQISTKVSAPGGVDESALADLTATAYREAHEVYDLACERYPTGNGAA